MLHTISQSNIHNRRYYTEMCGIRLQYKDHVNNEHLNILTLRTYKAMKLA
jgi:hypothetical protein